MKDRYSVFGPEPRLPSDMLRAILVSAAFKITSYTRFAADLKENLLHAIISGFFVGNTPSVGTFYDFHRRLWLSSDKNLTNAVRPPKLKPQKPKGKEQKAAPVEKLTVYDLFQQFEKNLLLIWLPVQNFGKFSILFSFRILPAWGLSL